MAKKKYKRPKVKSEREGKVTRAGGKPVRVSSTISTSGGRTNVKSEVNKRVTGDPGNYVRRKKVKSISSGKVKRDSDGKGVRY
jgi:hypothetical protein